MPRTEASVANLEVFVKTFELGNFTRAAVDLGLTPQAASRALARLEEHLGTTLFRRTTRRLEPTEAGRRYYARCRQALDLLAAGARELANEAPDQRGTVRISAGTPWGHYRLVPALAELVRSRPNIDFVVQIDNRNIDFVRDGFDCAIRLGAITDRTLVARKLGEHALGLYAAPAYLAERPAPRTVADLARHRCIGFRMPGSGRVLPWELGGTEVTPVMAFLVEGDALAAVSLARAGAGIVHAYDFVVEREVARGELVEVMPATRGITRTFSLLYPKAVIQTPAMKQFVAFVSRYHRP